jgi:hypothetical protein
MEKVNLKAGIDIVKQVDVVQVAILKKSLFVFKEIFNGAS